MCRLAFIPGQAPITKAQLLCLLDDLEVSFGGDGNGYVMISPKNQIKHSKGIKLNNETIANENYKLIRQGWAMYYHTRKISVGWADDNQCHPFEIKGPKFRGYLCHNGTWADGGVLARYFKCGSDTAALAKLLGKFTVEELKAMDLFPHSGVFLIYGAKPGETPTHKVIKQSGDLAYCGKSKVWASEFDNDWVYTRSTYKVDNGQYMLEKPAPFPEPIVKKSSNPSVIGKRIQSSKEIAEQYALNPWKDKVSPMWMKDRYYTQDWEELDQQIDSTYVDRNLLQ